MRLGAGLAALLAVAAVPALAGETQPGAAAGPPQPARTTMLGSREQQFLLAKITVSDLRRSYEFYTRAIGLKWATAPEIPLAVPLGLDDPDPAFAEIPLNFTGSLADPFFVIVRKRGSVPSAESAGQVWVGFKVADAAAAVERATAAGATLVRQPNAGAMRFGFVRDPDGYNIEFIQAASHPDRGSD